MQRSFPLRILQVKRSPQRVQCAIVGPSLCAELMAKAKTMRKRGISLHIRGVGKTPRSNLRDRGAAARQSGLMD